MIGVDKYVIILRKNKEFEENHQYGIIKPLNLCGGEVIRKIELSKMWGI